ncbi:MAG: hypothetical protein U0Q15_20695 [Kineosporiaceae bacterium]
MSTPQVPPPWQSPPGQPPPPAPPFGPPYGPPYGPPPRVLDVPATLAQLRSAQQAYSVSLIGAVVLQLLDLPWALAAGVLGVMGIVFGVRALVLGGRLQAAGVRTRGRAAVGVGLVLASMLVLQTLVRLALYPVEHDYQECSRQAQTRTAQEECDKAREARLRP